MMMMMKQFASSFYQRLEFRLQFSSQILHRSLCPPLKRIFFHNRRFSSFRVQSQLNSDTVGLKSVSGQRNARNELTKLRTHCKERKKRNEMTSLLDKPITAASDDGVCRWHAAKLWQTCAKLLKLNSICIISCTTSKNVLSLNY